jgi:hypothetical protein
MAGVVKNVDVRVNGEVVAIVVVMGGLTANVDELVVVVVTVVLIVSV